MKDRSREDLLADILKAVGDGNTITRIMYDSYLSYTKLKELMPVLQKSKMMQKRGRVYHITKKGKRYVQKHREIDKMMPFDV